MAAYPKLLVSSVVRGSQQGDSHGGLYLVDIAARDVEQVVDWNTSTIDFEGRGADRGLRGIVVVGKEIFVAASDELFVYDPWFRIVTSYRNPYLKHCHEMSVHGNKLYLTSTGFDSLLRLDLKSREFDLGIQITNDNGVINVKAFDPRKPDGAQPRNVFHINNVHVDDTGVFVSGRHMPALVQITQTSIAIAAGLPRGTHNARPFRGGVLFNDTNSDAVVWSTRDDRVESLVPRYPKEALLHTEADASGVARQAFARGLCPISDALIAAGSSPTTIAIHDLEAEQVVASINLTMDMRNAAHGLAIWPF